MLQVYYRYLPTYRAPADIDEEDADDRRRKRRYRYRDP